MARQTKGRLYKAGKKGAYHLQYYVSGKEFKITLKDENGDIITTEKKAKIAADKILHPVKAATKAEQLRQIREAVESAEEKAERLAQEQEERRREEAERVKDERATIANGWKLFMECPKRPASCKRFSIEAIPRHTTAANYRSYYERFSIWIDKCHPNIRLLSEVNSDIAAAFMETIRQAGATGTYNKYLQFFNCFFDTLAGAGKITAVNPFQDIDRAAHQYNSKKPLTVEQIARLIDSADGDMRLLVALGYFTGLRLGDCCTLQWREIDLLRGVIERIPRKTEHTIKDPAQAVVKIGIAPYLFDMLSVIPKAKRDTYLLPKFAELYLAGRDQLITKWILKHFQSCGIETQRPGTGRKIVTDPETGEPVIDKKTGKPKTIGCRAVVEVGFHSLRYSYISHNAEAGTPAAVIQRNAGHANPAMTEHYTRISDHAAVKYAAVLRLPADTATNTEEECESERVELHRLADTLPIDTIRKLFEFLKAITG